MKYNYYYNQFGELSAERVSVFRPRTWPNYWLPAAQVLAAIGTGLLVGYGIQKLLGVLA